MTRDGISRIKTSRNKCFITETKTFWAIQKKYQSLNDLRNHRNSWVLGDFLLFFFLLYFAFLDFTEISAAVGKGAAFSASHTRPAHILGFESGISSLIPENA